MAFMMPVVKKDYTLYAGGAKKHPDCPDGRRSRQSVSGAVGTAGNRRRIRSEGPSLTTSPKQSINSEALAYALRQEQASKPMIMRRIRGSAPILGQRQNSLLLHCTPGTAPTGNTPIRGSSPSSRSDSMSSESSDHGPNSEKFHLKLLSRLRKSLRIAPKSSQAPAPAAATTPAAAPAQVAA